ncbi:membrane-associated protein, putative, partial [Bodo saltans]
VLSLWLLYSIVGTTRITALNVPVDVIQVSSNISHSIELIVQHLPLLPQSTIVTLRVIDATSQLSAVLPNSVFYGFSSDTPGCPVTDRGECNLHGSCLAASMSCLCQSDNVFGHWAGAGCTTCLSGYFGSDCLGRCPGLGCSVCFGHGVCNDGLLGSGLCACDYNARNGYWSPLSDCSDCTADYYGIKCTLRCTVDPVYNLTCAGHGTCNSGISGTGSCVCNVGFASLACTTCATGYFGTQCSACPSANDEPCSGHGSCSDGLAGNGTCRCTTGYTGITCSTSCPVTFNSTCGWGSCRSNGSCACPFPIAVDVASGSCSTCVEGYWGPRCNDTCNCVHGSCSPSTGACTCSSGYWGPSCSNVCPGGVASPCTKHGTCNVTDGSCTCFANMSHGFYSGVRCDACNPLYNSPHCDVLCPHDPVTLVPCARRGLCYNGSCSGRCLTGLWGPNCDKECPGGELTPCSLSGTCNEDSGSCECFKGYAGTACQYSCPPGDETAPPCHNNGRTDTAQCLCFANSSVGFWGGAACDRCAAQYTGATCNVYCNPVGGKVYENKCLCSSGYSGISCDLICPTSVDGSVCANHGMCLASNGTAVCQCAEQYYGPACEAWCTPDNCVTEFHMYRAQCNVKTGTCECLASILGNFSGPSCDKCASGFWGAECDGQCTCNGWACDRYKGTCMCSAGFGSGRWTGSTCSECAEHHIGVDCSQRNLEVSDVKTASVGVSNNGFPRRGIAFHDPKTNVLLVGSNPIATFQTEPWMTSMIPLQTISLSSAAIKCDIQNDTHLVLYLLPAGAGGADLPIVFLNRSALVSPAASNVSIGTASTATRSLLDSSRKASVLSIAPNSFELVVDTSTSCTMYFVPRINASSHSTLTIQCPNMWTTPYQIPVPTTTITWMGFVGNFAVVTWSLTAGSTPSWGMYVIRYDTNSVSMVLNTTGSVVSIPECTARQGCGSVSHCIAPRLAAAANASSSIWPSNVIVCGAATALPTKNAVIFFVLDVVAGITQTTSTVVPEATGLTAAIIDVGYNNAIFAFTGATTATLCRIQLSDPLALITLFPIERINGERPEILSMAINETTRTLWLSVGTAEAVRAVAVNLFSVRIVEPEVFDQLGGVTVTVTGLGFVPSPTPLCDFHSKMTATSPSISSAPAVYINSTTLLCRAAEVSAYDTNCATLSLNVWYGERVTRTTLAGTSRPLSVTLDAATTTESGGLSSSRHLLSSTITLTGFGFVLGATAATCRIEEANGDVVAVLQAIPLGATEALCVQHSGVPSTHRGSVIRYSHDAFVYSESSTPFTVVGEWAGFSVHPTSVTLQSAPKSLAPTVTVFSVDSNGNSLLLLDSAARDVVCSSIAPALLADALAPQLLLDPSTINVVTTINGTAPFSKIVLATPLAGIMTIYFFTRLDLTISTTLRITVTPGLPSKITFSPGTSPMSWTSGVTTAFTIPSFSVVVKDVAGNVVIGGGSVALPREITVNYVNVLPVTPSPNETRTSVETPVAFTSTANSRTSAYDFGGLSLRSPFAVDVTLRFTCVDANITALTFTVPQESCGSGRYGERGAYECFLCPAHASCDGSTSIDADPGYWRGSITSPYLYACSPAEGCRSSTECAAGYIGALCGSCALGFGRTVSTCDACTSTVVPWVFVALIVVGLVVLVWGLGLRSVAFSAPADVDARVVNLPAKRSAVPVVIKLALSHVQILALLPLRRLAVGFIGDALESSGSWSVVTPGFLNVACVIGRRAFNEMIATVALVGLVIVGCIVLAVLIAKRDNGRFRDEARRQAAKQRAKLAKDAQASPMRFRAADVAHTAALFRSSKNRVEVLRNHFHLIDEYDGDVLARHQIAPHDFQGWLEADIEVDEKEDAKFIALEELVAPVAPDGVPPAYIRRPAVWTRVVNITLISIVVTTFLLYPTVVQAAVRTMQCHAVRISNAVSISVLSYDPVVECTSSEYHSGQLPAVAVLVAFGAGVPLLCPLVILFARRFTCGGRLDRACQLFFFVTGGYRVWFWEGLVLARKAVIVVVLVLMADDDQASCIICMWVLAGCLALNATQRPWEAQRLGSLEALSLATLSLTSLCLAALAGSPDVSTAWSLALVVVVAVMNILVGVAVAFMFVTAAADEIAEVIPEEAFGLKALRIASLQRNKRNMLSDIEQAHSRAARISSAATATLGALNHLADEDLEVTTEAEVISLRRGGSSNGSSSCNLKGSTQSGKGRLNSAESTSFRLTSESSFDPLDDQPIAERAVVFSRQGPRGSRPGVGLQQLQSPPPQLRPPSRDRPQSSIDKLPGAFKRSAPQRIYEHYWDQDVEIDDTLTAILPAPSPPTAIRRSSLLASNQLRNSVATLFYEDIELSENALDSSPRLGVEELQYDDDISVSAISDEEEKYTARSPRTRVGLEALPSPAKLNPLPASFYGDVDLSDDDTDTTVRSVVIDVARPLESPAMEDSAPPPVVAPVESAELLELGRHSSSTLHRRLWKLWAFLPRQLLALEADLQLSSVDTSNSPAVVMLTQLSLCRRQRQLLNALYDLELALTKKLAQHEEPAPLQLGRKLRRAPRSPPVQNPVSHPQTTSHGWQEGNWDEVQPSGGGDHVIDQFDI